MDALLQRFQDYIDENKLFGPDNRLLIALSGGADSVVLLDLLAKKGYEGIVAHCNFHLRGSESDADQAFACEYARQKGYKFYKKEFDTQAYALRNKLSIEMAARELRYAWFNQLTAEHALDYIITGHHLDDQVETFFINLVRGTGLKGITGMPATSGNVRRPLLFATRQEIIDYTRAQNLAYRQDSSNASVDIMRNYLRHKIIPQVAKTHGGFYRVMHENFRHFGEAYQLIKQQVHDKMWPLTSTQYGITSIKISELKKLYPARTYLYEYLAPYGFHGNTVDRIIRSLDGPAGKKFFAEHYRVVKDRNHLLLTTLPANINPQKWSAQHSIILPGYFGGQIMLKADYIHDYQKIKTFSTDVAYLDVDRLQFPLVIRRWQKGDYFYPTGMRGRKKLKDFFTDQKLSLPDKERTWILESGNEIAWIVGMRIDDRFRATQNSRIILKVSLSETG